MKALEDPQEKKCEEHVQGEIFNKDYQKTNSTVFACTCEAHESTRQRIPESQNKDHGDHIAQKGFKSLSHGNLVHKLFLVHQAMKTPRCEGSS